MEVRILPDTFRKILFFSQILLIVFLEGCSSFETTLQEKLLLIETPVESCPNISGSYEFIGAPLAGMSKDWRGMNQRLSLDLLMWPDKLPQNRSTIKEVEIIQDGIIEAIFKGDFGQESLIVPESQEDRIGCGKGQIIQIRTREAHGEAVSGRNVIKNMYSINPDGSLNITVEVVGHLRSFPFFLKVEETYGAKFSPVGN